jgi:hypothetical protein
MIGLGKLLSISMVALLRSKNDGATGLLLPSSSSNSFYISIHSYIASAVLLSPSTFLDRRVFGCANRHDTKHTPFLLPRRLYLSRVCIHIKYINLIRAIERNETEWESLSRSLVRFLCPSEYNLSPTLGGVSKPFLDIIIIFPSYWMHGTTNGCELAQVTTKNV